MFDVNLPAYPYKIRHVEGKREIFDPLRRRYVALTPEEWVRQHFVHYLITEKGYPKGRLVNEAVINLNGQQRRCDSLLYDESLTPLVIVEYKAPTITINQAVFEQIAAYNWVLRAKYLIVSNGMKHYCCALDYERHTVQFIENIPAYHEL